MRIMNNQNFIIFVLIIFIIDVNAGRNGDSSRNRSNREKVKRHIRNTLAIASKISLYIAINNIQNQACHRPQGLELFGDLSKFDQFLSGIVEF